MRLLVDSGASRVVLTRPLAKRAGVDLIDDDFNQPVSTANGITMNAPVKWQTIEIGPLVLRDVPGSVSKHGLDEPLLGMSFLNKLHSWRIEGDTLILVP